MVFIILLFFIDDILHLYKIKKRERELNFEVSSDLVFEKNFRHILRALCYICFKQHILMDDISILFIESTLQSLEGVLFLVELFIKLSWIFTWAYEFDLFISDAFGGNNI